MKDGRKYIAGDEFTAAGDLSAAPTGNALAVLEEIIMRLALVPQESVLNRLSLPLAGHIRV